MLHWSQLVAGLRRTLENVWGVVRRPSRDKRWAHQLSIAQQAFHPCRERLELRFFNLAANSGRPRGLIWTEIDFASEVTYARSIRGGDLQALVACTVSFEAVPGGPMEDVEAVSNLRAATAVFRYVEWQWQTDGQVIFNLSPTDAVAYYRDQWMLVAPSSDAAR